ncbi:MAG: DUF1573 domain-containing protein [Flavobacteriales bacterium]|nr:DUF1573 domain-containing protein [Flavobacteriales bacterium]MCB9174414.1 DUF1573 domain-containing protein [Flavobacteriales bacterium]
MKRLILSVAIVSVLFACSGNNDSQELTTDLINNPNSASSSEVDKDELPFFEFVEEVVDFGTITQGEVVSTNFKFKNVGKSDLIISSAQGSCGCTVPEWPKEPIKPGEEGKIAVTFNSTGKQGKQNKTITLVANTIPNTKVIALKGDVLVPKGHENDPVSE